jgi:UDP-N-acetylglucosamine 2-epimerase
MKIASIVGARPNFIKLAPISKELRKNFEEIIIHTGQHYDYEMDRVFFEQLGIPKPDYHLNIGSGSHGRQTGEMLKGIEEVLVKDRPDLTIVFGDTNTTLSGALSAAKLHIKVAHVEAGLRSYNRLMPEEINRVLTDHCSDFLFCPTPTAVKILASEGITDSVYLTGDVMVDILEKNADIAETRSSILSDLDIVSKKFILTTIHRAENTDNIERLSSIVQALSKIAKTQDIVFPCHPRTEKQLKLSGLWDDLSSSVKITRPVGYMDMLLLEKNASKIMTDSGGVQKEAYIFGVPCITVRDETEWIETVEDGWNILTGADKGKIIRAAEEFCPERNRSSIFGDGNASVRIADVLKEEL